MSGDNVPVTPKASDAPSLTDAESNRQISQGQSPHAVSRHDDTGSGAPGAGERLPNVGNAHAPVATDDIENRESKDLYERLADKDVTPNTDNGSKPI